MLNQALWNVSRAGSMLFFGRWMVMAWSKVFLGPTETEPNEFRECNIACSIVVVLANSHHRSRGSIPQRSQILAAKQTPILQQSVIISQEEKLINFDLVNPLSKSSGGRGRMSNFVLLGAGNVLVCYNDHCFQFQHNKRPLNFVV